MPRFSPDVDDIFIDPTEFMGSCNKDDIREVIEWLIDNGNIKEQDTDIVSYKMGLSQSIFQECLNAISSNYYQLTNEEEELILKIGKKFK